MASSPVRTAIRLMTAYAFNILRGWSSGIQTIMSFRYRGTTRGDGKCQRAGTTAKSGSHTRSAPGGCGDAPCAVVAGWAGRRHAGRPERRSVRGGRRTLTIVAKQFSSAEDVEGPSVRAPPFETLVVTHQIRLA